jgi:hypothetical protein
MDCFIINNITENDVISYKLRILVENKTYFPIPNDEISKTYDIRVKVGSKIYDRQYRYNRNKSGRLNIGAELYRDKLRINAGDVLVVVVLEENSLYQIINLTMLK